MGRGARKEKRKMSNLNHLLVGWFVFFAVTTSIEGVEFFFREVNRERGNEWDVKMKKRKRNLKISKHKKILEIERDSQKRLVVGSDSLVYMGSSCQLTFPIGFDHYFQTTKLDILVWLDVRLSMVAY